MIYCQHTMATVTVNNDRQQRLKEGPASSLSHAESFFEAETPEYLRVT